MERENWKVTHAQAQGRFKSYCMLADEALDWLFKATKEKDETEKEICMLRYRKFSKLANIEIQEMNKILNPII